MLETYTNKDAIEFYKDVTNWQGKKGGDISNNICVYACDGTNYVNPAIIGLTLCKSVDNPGVKFVIVVHVKDTVGCSINDIHKRRLEMKNAIVRYTANQNFDIDIVYLPQIKRGTGKENMRKFATPVEEFSEE